jgi:ribulose bisphosphate carboxylase small subunit
MLYVLKKGKQKLTLEFDRREGMYSTPEETTYFLKKQTAEYERKIQKQLKQYLAKGYAVTTIGDKPKKKLSKAERFKLEADEVISMWKKDEYDNYKDALTDVRDLLKAVPKELPNYKIKLTKLQQQVIKEAKSLAKKDKKVEKYLKGIL